MTFYLKGISVASSVTMQGGIGAGSILLKNETGTVAVRGTESTYRAVGCSKLRPQAGTASVPSMLFTEKSSSSQANSLWVNSTDKLLYFNSSPIALISPSSPYVAYPWSPIYFLDSNNMLAAVNNLSCYSSGPGVNLSGTTISSKGAAGVGSVRMAPRWNTVPNSSGEVLLTWAAVYYNVGARDVSIGESYDGGNYNVTVGSRPENGLGSHNVTIGSLFNNYTWKNLERAVTIGSYVQGTVAYDTDLIAIGTRCVPNIGSISIGHEIAAPAGQMIFGDSTYFTKLTCYAAYVGIVGATRVALYNDASGYFGYITSSVRFKENIRDYSGSILSLQPKRFDYVDSSKGTDCIGLIAEDVNVVYPSAVCKDKGGLPESVNYVELVTALVDEVKKLESRRSALRTRLDALKE
jgi:hypothetical protein